MLTKGDLLGSFRKLFGERGGDRDLGNIERSHNVAAICHATMEIDEPILLEYFEEWDKRPENGRKPYAIEQDLVRLGQWEGAWALAQLHYDQLLKQEARSGTRRHKGHPLCNIALVGQAVGSQSLTRHYALLSSVGDVYWEHAQPTLESGGLAPALVERYESRREHYDWRRKVRDALTNWAENDPVYLEALLASRWFSESLAKHITDLATVRDKSGEPFEDLLLDSVETPKDQPALKRGTRFEAAVGLLLSRTPGFEVDSARKTTDEQLDLVVCYGEEPLSCIGLQPGFGLVECKSSGDPVGAKDLRDFGAKCLFHRVNFGILVARAGTTGASGKSEEKQHAELVRRRFQLDGLTLLVLEMAQLRGTSRDLRGVARELAADYRRLVFGPIA